MSILTKGGVFVKKRWRVCCSPAFAAAALLLLISSGSELWLFWLAALLHELGHLAALYLLQGRAEQIRFRLTGAEICYSGSGLSYGNEVFLALAGPAANLLWACVTALAAKTWPSPLLYRFIGCHLTLALFNLLPALPLDGGRALKALLESCFPLWGEQSAQWISFALGMILTATGAYFLKKGGNPTLLFAGLAILRHALPKSPLHPAKKLLK